MKYLSLNSKTIPTLIAFISGLLLFSIPVNAQQNETYIQTTEKNVKYEVIGWEPNVVYNPHTFTWFAWEDPIIRKKTVKEVDMVPVSEFERPPVFTGECLTAADKFACTNKKLKEYASDRFIDYPDAASAQGQEGLEYVTFTLDEEGNFEGNLKVIAKNEPCQGCAETAVNIVSEMEDQWFPAIKDGETVKTQLTIPIRFDLRQNN